MLNLSQLREDIIQPSLQMLRIYSVNAEELLVGICAHESKGGTYVKQLSGPALGLYQMEPFTHDSIWNQFINANTGLSRSLLTFLRANNKPAPNEMVYNLFYATMMARIFFMRFKETIPDSIEGQAAYWKKYYNTVKGKGTVEDYLKDYETFTVTPKKRKSAA